MEISAGNIVKFFETRFADNPEESSFLDKKAKPIFAVFFLNLRGASVSKTRQAVVKTSAWNFH